jgi:hypothetical protein
MGCSQVSDRGVRSGPGSLLLQIPSTEATAHQVSSATNDQAMFVLLLHGRHHHVQNQGHRTSGIDVRRPYLCQRRQPHCSLGKFSRHWSLDKFSCVGAPRTPSQ